MYLDGVRKIKAECPLPNQLKDEILSGPIVLLETATRNFWSFLGGKKTRIEWRITGDGQGIVNKVIRMASVDGMECRAKVCVIRDKSETYDCQYGYERGWMDLPYGKLEATIVLVAVVDI